MRCRSDRSPPRKVPEVTQRSNPMHVRLRMVTALLASLVRWPLRGLRGRRDPGRHGGARACGTGAAAVRRQRHDHRSAAVQLRQRRPHLRSGRRVLRLLQRDQRRPPLQRGLLLRHQRALERRPPAARSARRSRAHPSATSPNGTSLGNTTHQDTLYIPVPLFANAPPTQCTATATCIDHPPTIDLSRHRGRPPGQPVAEQPVQRADPGARPRRRARATAGCPSGGTSRSWRRPTRPPSAR